MTTKPISPAMHGLIDYALSGSLLFLPTLFGFNKKVKNIYKAEALTLLLYVALSDHPAAVKPIISFRTHGKIDPLMCRVLHYKPFIKPSEKTGGK